MQIAAYQPRSPVRAMAGGRQPIPGADWDWKFLDDDPMTFTQPAAQFDFMKPHRFGVMPGFTYSRAGTVMSRDADGMLRQRLSNTPYMQAHDFISGRLKGLRVQPSKTNTITTSSFSTRTVGNTASPGSGISGVITAVDDFVSHRRVTWRFTGTATQTGARTILSFETGGVIPAALGSKYTFTLWASVSGTGLPETARMQLSGRGAGDSSLGGPTQDVPMTGVYTYNVLSTVVTNPSTLFLRPFFVAEFIVGKVYDFFVTVELPQVETGGASSPIPTDSSALTRAEEQYFATGSVLASLYNPVAGALFVESEAVDYDSSQNSCVLSLDDGTTNNRLQIVRQSNTHIEVKVTTAGVVQTLTGMSTSLGSTAKTKIALSWDNSQLQVYVNAGLIYSGACTMPNVTHLRLGSGAGMYAFNGYIQKLVCQPSQKWSAPRMLQMTSLQADMIQNSSRVFDFTNTEPALFGQGNGLAADFTFTRSAVSLDFYLLLGVISVVEKAVNQPHLVICDPSTNPSRPKGWRLGRARTNHVRNNRLRGLIVGDGSTSGTLPNFWSELSVAGLERRVVGSPVVNGVRCTEIRLVGVPSVTANYSLRFETPNVVEATQGQQWVASAWVQVSAGSTANTTLFLALNERAPGTVFVRNTLLALGNPSALSRSSVSAVIGSTTTHVESALVVNCTENQPIDITLRIGYPCLERDILTAPIESDQATTTVSEDVALITGNSFFNLFDRNSGSLYFDQEVWSFAGQPSCCLLSLDDGTTNNRLQFIRSSNTDFSVVATSGGVVVPLTGFVTTIASSSRTRVALSWQNSVLTVVVNGLVLYSGAFVMPDVNRLQLSGGVGQITANAFAYELAFAKGNPCEVSVMQAATSVLRLNLPTQVSFVASSAQRPYYNNEGRLALASRNKPILYAFDPTTLTRKGWLFVEQQTNRANSTMQGIVVPGTAPTNWGINSTTAGVVRFIPWAGTTSLGSPGMRVRYAGVTTSASFVAVGWATASSASITPGEQVCSRIMARLHSGSLANLSTVRLSNLTTNGSAGINSRDFDIVLTGDYKSFEFNGTVSSSPSATHFQPRLRFAWTEVGVPIDFEIEVTQAHIVRSTRILQPTIMSGVTNTTVPEPTVQISAADLEQLLSLSEGSLFIDAEMLGFPLTNPACLLSLHTDTNHRLQARVSPTGAINMRVVKNGVSLIDTGLNSPSFMRKYVLTWTPSYMELVGNGQLVARINEPSVVFNTLQLGSGPGSVPAAFYLRRLAGLKGKSMTTAAAIASTRVSS